ncbi:MAG TPA: hypothetical protein VMB05_07475 [Solirubrobacteraceae bacterium]|nr:hypothetical protein [Solirubrobacteraceae bacterium]HUB74482.1 hypothetical protein [Solirubrobacteraceae bacterium]
MPIDQNNVDELFENLIAIYRTAIIKGINVRMDENNEMIVTHPGGRVVRILPTGEVVSVT